MSRLRLLETRMSADDFFDRQERVEGWDQSRIRAAHVLVVGAGALGNETLKNLALLGYKNLTVIDLDLISTSNLSRTVLFGPADVGLPKAHVAAKRTLAHCLEPDARVLGFYGDVVWEIGTGLFRSVDIVLGCVDNVEARLAINRQCSLAETPWIDAGLLELSGQISLFKPPKSACYQCGLTKRQLATSRRRYSCDEFKRKVVAEGFAPTVQVTSSLISAIQVQEATKLLLNMPVRPGVRYHYLGACNSLVDVKLRRRDDCPAHLSYPELKSLELSRQVPLGEFLKLVENQNHSGSGAVLDLGSERSFVLRARCRSCSQWIDLRKPRFAIYDTDVICGRCDPQGIKESRPSVPTAIDELNEFGLGITPDSILALRLEEIGVPLFSVLPVRDPQGEYQYYELIEDEFPKVATPVVPNTHNYKETRNG